MNQQQVVEVDARDVMAAEDVAKAECESAKQAALIAGMAATEAQGNGMPGDMRNEWAQLARTAAGLAWAHALRAEQLAPPLSGIARAAKEHVGRAKGHARAAELACHD